MISELSAVKLPARSSAVTWSSLSVAASKEVSDADESGGCVGVEPSGVPAVEESPLVGVEAEPPAGTGVDPSSPVGAGVETSPTGDEPPSSRSTEQPDSAATTRTATTSSGRDRIGGLETQQVIRIDRELLAGKQRLFADVIACPENDVQDLGGSDRRVHQTDDGVLTGTERVLL
jgi:hypothetical protein